MKRGFCYCIIVFLIIFFYADQAFSLTLYVNPSTGRDVFFNGRSEQRPFKTINYALSSITQDSQIKLAAGIYNETLVFEKLLSIQLIGEDPYTTIIRGNSSTPTITINGPNRVTLNNIAIENGSNGVYCKFSYVTFINVHIHNNSSHGIYAKGNSHVDMNMCKINSNLAHGVRVHSGSSAQLVECELSQNASAGLQAMYTSFAEISKSTVNANNGDGIHVNGNSSVSMWDNEIKSNKESGVGISGDSQAGLWGGNNIHDNADNSGWRAGIGAYHGSQVSIMPQSESNKDQIHDNHGPGVYVTNSGGLFLKSGIVSDNHGDGIGLQSDSVAQFDTGATIFDNEGFGLDCLDQLGDSKYFGVLGVVSGNISGNINCDRY